MLETAVMGWSVYTIKTIKYTTQAEDLDDAISGLGSNFRNKMLMLDDALSKVVSANWKEKKIGIGIGTVSIVISQDYVLLKIAFTRYQ